MSSTPGYINANFHQFFTFLFLWNKYASYSRDFIEETMNFLMYKTAVKSEKLFVCDMQLADY